MQPDKSVQQEFIFIRDKLQTIASLLLDNEKNSLVHAFFILGCLHEICHQNSMIFQDRKCKADLHE